MNDRPDVERTKVKDALAKREVWILILVGALMFVAALALQGWQSDKTYEVLLRGVQDLGLSLIEAALVMVIIELRASREQIEQSLELIQRATNESRHLIKESIEETQRAAAQSRQMTRVAIDSMFKSVYQKNVPNEMIDHYEAHVFRRDFFRRNDVYIYTLKPPFEATPEDVMHVQVHHEYVMHNLTEDDLEYPFRCETSLPPNAPQNPAWRFFDLQVDGQPFPGGETKTIEYPGEKALELTHKIPISRGGNRHIEVSWTIARRVRDSEVLVTGWPSNGVTIHVNYDQSLVVTVNPLHPRKLREVPTGDGSKKWSLMGGMIEGQAIYLSWEPRVSQAAA